MPKPWIEIPPLELTRNPGKWPMLELRDSSTSEEEGEDSEDDSMYDQEYSDESDSPSVERFKAGDYRNWAELPPDILSIIFKKIAAIEILQHAQLVCMPWRKLSLEPEIWREIDMTTLHGDQRSYDYDMERMTRQAINRSRGRLEVLEIEYFGSDELMDYLAEKTTVLRCLRLISVYSISDEALTKAISRSPLFEELEITFGCGSFTEDVCRSVGQACPNLKYFRRNEEACRHLVYQSDEEALGIANNMPELRELQLIGNHLTNEGLVKILDRCLHLESLDIRCCFNINFDANIRAKCKRIKKLRLPNDPTNDCGFIVEVGGPSPQYFGNPDVGGPGPGYFGNHVVIAEAEGAGLLGNYYGYAGGSDDDDEMMDDIDEMLFYDSDSSWD